MLKALKVGGRLLQQASGCSPHPDQLSISPATAAAAFRDVVNLDHDHDHDEKHASEKMVNEGGGSLNCYHEVKEEVRKGTKAPSFSPVSDTGEHLVGKGQEAVNKTVEGSQHMTEKGREALDRAKEGGQHLAEKGREMMDKTKEGSQHMAEKGKEAMGEMMDGRDSDSDTTGGGGQSGMDTIVNHAKKEMNTAKDMMSDMPKKVHDTTEGLKEVGVEAVEAIKRDVSRLVEKAGLKDPSPEDHQSHKDQDKAGGI
ncbi:hypothetical protein O6H91_Y340200 [Diphasiastrum complanatum]|nr:hypothetical protein O6H91_Y340200 [Diphasiastrum complanatum]